MSEEPRKSSSIIFYECTRPLQSTRASDKAQVRELRTPTPMPSCLLFSFPKGKRSSEVHTITIKSTARLHLFLTAAAAFSFRENQPGSACHLHRQTEDSSEGKQPLLGKFFKIILHIQQTLQRTLKSCF